MALKAEIYKAELEVVDMDRNHFQTYRLTLACHPSETIERMMLRLLAFALNAGEGLAFGKGVSDSDEPDLWLRDYEGRIKLWVELGHPDEKILSKAVKQAERVIVYTFSGRPELWWDPIKARFAGKESLSVYNIAPTSAAALGKMAERAMDIQVSVQDGEIWVRSGAGAEHRVELGRL
jgi:uncharacterized protein YaeQ